MRTFAALFIVTGCAANGDGDSASLDCAGLYGYDCPTADAQEALDRVNALRAAAGLAPTVLESRLDVASQAHTDFMADNSDFNHYEDASKPGYTGDWVWDRMETAGYPLEPGRVWMEVISKGLSPAAAVDGWVGTVYHRIPFTSVELIEVGFGYTDDYAGMALVLPFPDAERSAVLYPADGQVDVPTSFDSDTEIPDPAPGHGVVGYPISVSVGEPLFGNASTEDPYGLRLISASVSGPEGAVDLLSLDPSNDSYMFNMAAVMPVSPLSAATTYDVEMVVEFGGSSETLTGSFTTR
jgi:hypothetical protein